MKRILILLLVLLNFGLLHTNAGDSKLELVEVADQAVETVAIETKYDYKKSYEISKKIWELVNKYYYSIVFDKKDEAKIYWDIEKKIVEYNKVSKRNSYYKESTINEFLDYPNNQEIINKLWYHTIKYYNDYSGENSLFLKEHKISLDEIKLNNKVEWLYLWIKVDEFNQNDRYSDKQPTRLKTIYTKYNKDKKVHFTKVNLEKYKWKIKIDISKIIKKIDTKKSYRISFNFYLKKWDNYISLINRNIINYFSFDKYTVKSFLDRKYREETNPRWNYYSNNSARETLEENLNNKLKIIFDKIKSKKTEKEYLSFLETVKTKVITFSSDKEKYDNLVESIIDNNSFNIAYKKYKKYKDQEKIINTLLVFVSNEIYENTLEDTISDFIK